MATGSDAPPPPIPVCVVEHHPLATLYLEEILRRDPGLEIVSRSLLLDTAADSPRRGLHVFILDLSALPTALNKLLRFIHVRFRRAKVLLLGEPQSDDELCRLLFLGVQGFLPYSEVKENLVAAVRAVADDGYWLPAGVLEQFETTSSRLLRRKTDLDVLSFRERRVVELVKRRLTNAEIASILNVSETTVTTYLTRIFGKLGVRDRQAILDATAQPAPLPKPK
ncbi:MAG TPA: response regulator transcription factor [Candidatus Xenobia bacterium]|nr:response regulator transcription factor [Candidatus Xenobia bacterium]